jgi:hypothetical protein
MSRASPPSPDVEKHAVQGARAAAASLLFGYLAVLGLVVGAIGALPGEVRLGLLFVAPMSALGGNILARRARGSYPRGSKERWPGRRNALAGAVLSCVVLATYALVVGFLLLFLVAGPNEVL